MHPSTTRRDGSIKLRFSNEVSITIYITDKKGLEYST